MKIKKLSLFDYHTRTALTEEGNIGWAIMRTNKLTGTVKQIKNGANHLQYMPKTLVDMIQTILATPPPYSNHQPIKDKPMDSYKLITGNPIDGKRLAKIVTTINKLTREHKLKFIELHNGKHPGTISLISAKSNVGKSKLT